jgi:hypothetical protein
MARLKRLSIAVLLGVLLVAVLAGLARARPNARPLQQVWRVLTISPSDCVPYGSGISDWVNQGGYVECPGATNCRFYCPVHFPAAGEQAVGAVNVKRVTLYFSDQVAANMGVSLWKNHPPAGVEVEMAAAESFGIHLDDPATVMDTTIAKNPVYRNQGPYLEIVMDAAGHRTYGVYIHYTW